MKAVPVSQHGLMWGRGFLTVAGVSGAANPDWRTAATDGRDDVRRVRGCYAIIVLVVCGRLAGGI